MDEQPTGCSTRSLAIGGLAAYGVTVLLIVLIFVVPKVVATPGEERNSLFPPETVFVGFTGFFTIGLAVGLMVRCVVISVRNRQWAWLLVFLLPSLAGLLGPALLVTGFVHISQASYKVVVPTSAVGLLLVFVAALLSTLPSRRPGQA